MDDVDAVHAQMAGNMLSSGDWVTAHLNRVAYLEKAPLSYWLIAASYKIFGLHDWAARIPTAFAALAVCWLTTAFGVWAFGRLAGFYAGLGIATCVGLFLFTRILIPDVMLTFTTALAMWAFLRALDKEELHPRRWAFLFAASLGIGLLLKSLIAVLFPVASGVLYLALTGQLFSAPAWKRLRPASGALIVLLIAAPWHILAAVRNPPVFSLSLHSGPGQYHGFLWFFFMNEQVLRFLNLRYPRDYNTVPRLSFWLSHLLWLFPWSVYLPAAAKLSYKPVDRAGSARLLALCWIGFLLVFFTFSTTQEYYSMPIYPALAMLLGAAMAGGPTRWVRLGTQTLGAISLVCMLAVFAILWMVRGLPAPGDISSALQQHPEAYTLSLGHLGDLTLQSFAYLRAPLVVAGLGFFIGVIGVWRLSFHRAALAVALMMVCFMHASRMALVVFDPYLSSRPLAEALRLAPQGTLIVDGPYYPFSSVFFYANRQALLLNGRVNNLEYGSYAPGAPAVFIDDPTFTRLWSSSTHYYLLADGHQLSRLSSLAGNAKLLPVAASGGKFLFTNNNIAVLAGNSRPGDKGHTL
ncbi:MAG TPA: glycosyltransferase family 39 protein [Candidatus Saccharimonadales bacterium]|nr:glycosyltransferase family 39 protein [Candidatus Saccharimonadales bacterium]